MKVEVRPGQLWELTDRSGTARTARVVRVSEPIEGVRHVYLRRNGSGGPMRSTLHRLERQIEGARLIEDNCDYQPAEHMPDPVPPTPAKPPACRETLHLPRMSADERRAAIATARRLQVLGYGVVEIAEVLSILPEVVEGWLRGLPTEK